MGSPKNLQVTPSRFELARDGHTAIIEYRRHDNVISLIHTEVPTELRGGGIGSDLVRAALDWSREQKLKVLPSCPFVRAWIERHPDYSGLTA